MKKIRKIFAFILVFFQYIFYILCRKCFLLKIYTYTCLCLWSSLPPAFFLQKNPIFFSFFFLQSLTRQWEQNAVHSSHDVSGRAISKQADRPCTQAPIGSTSDDWAQPVKTRWRACVACVGVYITNFWGSARKLKNWHTDERDVETKMSKGRPHWFSDALTEQLSCEDGMELSERLALNTFFPTQRQIVEMQLDDSLSRD